MNFVKTESTEKPKKVELADKMAYIRRNIKCEERKTDDQTTKMYVYEEAICTKDEAINYLSKLNESLEKENSDNNESILDLDFRVSELEG